MVNILTGVLEIDTPVYISLIGKSAQNYLVCPYHYHLKSTSLLHNAGLSSWLLVHFVCSQHDHFGMAWHGKLTSWILTIYIALYPTAKLAAKTLQYIPVML